MPKKDVTAEFIGIMVLLSLPWILAIVLQVVAIITIKSAKKNNDMLIRDVEAQCAAAAPTVPGTAKAV